MVMKTIPLFFRHFPEENTSNLGCGESFVCCERLDLGSFTPEDGEKVMVSPAIF